jgi:hypothetical protein
MMLITFGIHHYEICTKNVFLIWNSDAPYESVVPTSLIPLQGRKSSGQLPSLLLKIEGGVEIVLPPLFGIKFKKKILFSYSMEAYVVHLTKGIRIFGQGML